jgi:hypothetical protein
MLDNCLRDLRREPITFPLVQDRHITLALRKILPDDPPITINLPFPMIVRAILLIVVVIGSGIKLSIFDGKSFGVILINEGYKIITIFFIGITLFGGAIVF